jgi:DNA-binding transcriptional LysR family regulator
LGFTFTIPLKMKSLTDLRLFVRTARSGSLSAAARQLDTTPAAASASLKRLERALGAPLFVRSTRSLRLTSEGETFLRHCEQALQALDDGCDAIANGRDAVRGSLLLAAPSDLGRNAVRIWMDEFQARHPDLQLRLRLADRRSDLYREPVDVALRYGLPSDSSMVALPLAPANRRVLCASPAWLARTGPLHHPHELADRNALCFVLGDDVHDQWRFTGPEGECVVDVRGDRVSDDGDVVRRWAVDGHGVACKSALDIADDLLAGRLVALCPEWRGEATPLHLVCADRRQLSPAIRELRAFLEAKCAQRLAMLSDAWPALF